LSWEKVYRFSKYENSCQKYFTLKYITFNNNKYMRTLHYIGKKNHMPIIFLTKTRSLKMFSFIK